MTIEENPQPQHPPMPVRRGWLRAPLTATLAVTALAAALVVPSRDALADDTNVSRAGLSATIRTTEYGIPHVLADDYADLGFGTGYAAARDNLCTIAGSMVVTSARSSRYFGPDERPRSLLTRAATNLSSDLYFAGINGSGAVERLLDQPAPQGPGGGVREMVHGYAAGFNEFLAEGHQSSCTDAEWLRPMTELDVYRFLYALGLVFGQGAAAEGVVAAQPPTQPADASGAGNAAMASVTGALAATERPGPASNGLALGGEATANGRGMVLANPHYFWQGDVKLWQVHQTIPGKVNVSGAAFLGLPFVAMGHTRSLAWSGTAADAATLYTLFELELAPGSPTKYLVDGEQEEMTRGDVTVEVRGPDGTIATETRPQWWTRYGPVVSSLGGMELPWTAKTAYALADPNTANLRLGDGLFALNHARRTRDVVNAAGAVQGLPWFNVTAADAQGRAAFVGPQVVPNVTDEHAARCNTELGQRTFADGLPVLDGSRSDCALGNHPDAPQPGIFGPDSVPILDRDDYVANSNSSHWLTNPGELMEGFPRIYGAERVEPIPRTRTGHLAVAEQLGQREFLIEDLQDLVLSNRALAGELARDDTVAMCEGMPGGVAPGTNGPVDVSAACDVLARWDLRMGTESRGALLFDRFWRNVWPTTQQPDVWTTPFDARDPIHTPRDLETTNPRIHRALADAVAELDAYEIPLDAPLGDYQYVVRGDTRFPISGGTNLLGVYNATEATWDEENGGYTDVPFGPTVLQVTSFDGDGCPESRTVLAYSQSSDPTSPHHADQTELFSRQEWITARFCERDILTSPDLQILKVTQD
jgi:acyl-homoserine-lactone acylase